MGLFFGFTVPFDVPNLNIFFFIKPIKNFSYICTLKYGVVGSVTF